MPRDTRVWCRRTRVMAPSCPTGRSTRRRSMTSWWPRRPRGSPGRTGEWGAGAWGARGRPELALVPCGAAPPAGSRLLRGPRRRRFYSSAGTDSRGDTVTWGHSHAGSVSRSPHGSRPGPWVMFAPLVTQPVVGRTDLPRWLPPGSQGLGAALGPRRLGTVPPTPRLSALLLAVLCVTSRLLSAQSTVVTCRVSLRALRVSPILEVCVSWERVLPQGWEPFAFCPLWRLCPSCWPLTLVVMTCHLSICRLC